MFPLLPPAVGPSWCEAEASLLLLDLSPIIGGDGQGQVLPPGPGITELCLRSLRLHLACQWILLPGPTWEQLGSSKQEMRHSLWQSGHGRSLWPLACPAGCSLSGGAISSLTPRLRADSVCLWLDWQLTAVYRLPLAL